MASDPVKCDISQSQRNALEALILVAAKASENCDQALAELVTTSIEKVKVLFSI